MGEFDFCVNLNYGWIWNIGEHTGDRHANRQTDRHTHRNINTITWPGLGAGPSENKHINININIRHHINQ